MGGMLRRAAPSLALLLLAGCAAGGGGNGGVQPAPSLDEARSRVESCRERLGAAASALRAEEGAARAAAARLRAEKEIAESALRQLREAEHPRRAAEADLAVARAADGLEDAKDELSQLEEMYQANDLAAKTKELVIKRGRRGLERAQQELSIRTRALRDLKETAIPLEIRKAEHDLLQKSSEIDLEEIRAQGRLAAKRAELADARAALRKAEAELSRRTGAPAP